MLRYLHTLSAVCFYVLGFSFFIAYALFKNQIAADAMRTWLESGDLPLLLSGVLYGALSIYLSIRNEKEYGKALMVTVALPAAIIFITMLILNFLP